jgi:hypothetical protein
MYTIPKILMRLLVCEIVIYELTQVDKDKFEAKKSILSLEKYIVLATKPFN